MSKDKIDIEKNARFMDVVQWLIDNGEAENQGDLTVKAGLGPNIISRIKNNHNIVSEDTIRALCEKFKDVNIDYIRGRSKHISRYNAASARMDDTLKENIKTPQLAIPEYVKQLCNEAARLATRNEMLERQCEHLIAELRDSKDKNDTFLAELRKSKEDNDALVAELRISRKQNDALISELRETKKNNGMLSAKLENAIESMKNQMSMMLSSYQQPPAFAHTVVNDESIPEGLIRGGYPAVTEELAQKATSALSKNKTKRA